MKNDNTIIWIFVAGIFMILLIFCACSSPLILMRIQNQSGEESNTEEDYESDYELEEEELEEETEGINLEGAQSYDSNVDVKIGSKVRWKVLSAQDLGNRMKSSDSEYPEDAVTRGKFIKVNFEIENLTKEPLILEYLNIIDYKKRIFDEYADTFYYLPKEEKSFYSDTLNPNVAKQYSTIFEVPNDSENIKLIVNNLEYESEDNALIYIGI